MDEADLAQANQEQFERLALQRQRGSMPQGEALAECEDCGRAIPEKRRQAVPGCTRCVRCQQTSERKRKEFR